MRDRQRWLKLCEQAAVEQDPKTFLALIEQIDALLQFEQDRIRGSGRSATPSPQAEGGHELPS